MAAIPNHSASQRAAVNLTYFDHLSQRDVVEIMHCPVDTVKTRVFHARRHLRRIIGGNTADWMD
jgi:RNA polymerase sigma-70 factor (ECF subfamily)